ncbi:hypothetical protein L596_002179 [Steinernema carpocapsae]|uniref:Integrase zinc-binding domain-containing protein n=1 Tax=Steinernema carpocapsae TaxID=34508 RepID=A0A4U8UNY3_STECR|nr:hypothetical protein L596_002179 [Steinernema carpocapsae]
MSVTEYDALVRFIADKILDGPTKAFRDSIRRKSKNFVLSNGVLFYRKTDVVRERNVAQVLGAVHVGRRHLEMNAHYSDLSDRYYWIGMHPDVEQFIKSCHKCQMNRVSLGFLRS